MSEFAEPSAAREALDALEHRRTRGSSKLTVEQQQWWLEKTGRRYLYVPSNLFQPNRRARRARRRGR